MNKTAQFAEHRGVIAEHKVIIVGCGHSGVINAKKLLDIGVRDFVILEASSRVGGCWRDNTYPGCACDVPSAFYSYSFRTNPDWSHTYAGQKEILSYIEATVSDLRLDKKLRLETELIEARWLPEERRWQLMTNRGEYRSQFVIFATGPLTKASFPDIEGLDSFEGEMFHSVKWNHDYSLEGKRVAVIGTGASSAQFIPEIQSKVKHLTIFQRTAPWVLPRPFDRDISDIEKLINQFTPVLQNLSRRRIEALLVGVNYALTNPWAMKMVEPYVRKIIKKQVPERELRKKISADFMIGCKRIIFSNDYYPTLRKPHVDLIASGLAAIDGNRAVAANGESAEVDAIIFGTGFDLAPPPIAKRIRGLDGRLMSERWQDEGAQAYLGTTTYDLPNAFIMVGPNIMVYSSFIEIVEWQSNYVISAIQQMDDRDIEVFKLLESTCRVYNERVQANLQKTVFNQGGCKSYYLDENGRNVASWPWSIPELRRKLSHFDLISYQIHPFRTEEPAPRLVSNSK
ncbi:MAG: NAD(P)/FAD-dependent oxidoreductase [Ketobacteraceae bacterium]|nr:NAD(P)/FAD-dependent oxidoreductase [Ketobacteraceae bacterium]